MVYFETDDKESSKHFDLIFFLKNWEKDDFFQPISIQGENLMLPLRKERNTLPGFVTKLR